MARLIFLGTADAVAYPGHENSFFAVEGERSTILIDCPARPLQRLNEAGVQIEHMDDLFITHFHPDHVSGLPNLLMDMWLTGRKNRFNVHGNSHVISRAQKMMELFEWDSWTGMYPVTFHIIPSIEFSPVVENADFRVLSSPVEHMVPGLGFRVEISGGKFILAYSGDTNPIEPIVRLASNADILIHEAAGSTNGHTTAAEAGDIAARARAKVLYLIHYFLDEQNTKEFLLAEANKTFPGKVYLAEDLLAVECSTE